MTHYMLSIYQPAGPPPSDEVLEPIMRDLEALTPTPVVALNRAVAVTEAARAYEAALARAGNEAERDFLRRRLGDRT